MFGQRAGRRHGLEHDGAGALRLLGDVGAYTDEARRMGAELRIDARAGGEYGGDPAFARSRRCG